MFDRDTGWYETDWSLRRVMKIGVREFKAVIGPLQGKFWATVNEVGMPTDQRFSNIFKTREEAQNWCQNNLKELVNA